MDDFRRCGSLRASFTGGYIQYIYIFLRPLWGTPPKFDIAPEKWWLEDDPFLLKRPVFRGYVEFLGCIFLKFRILKMDWQKRMGISFRASLFLGIYWDPLLIFIAFGFIGVLLCLPSWDCVTGWGVGF